MGCTGCGLVDTIGEIAIATSGEFGVDPLNYGALDTVGSPVYARVHNPAFSIIANPLDERFQNCAGLMLHVLVAAAWNVTDHEAVNLILREKFQPSRIDANAAVRLLGPLASSRLAAGDQDWTVSTASFESIDVFMRQNGLSQETFIFYFDPRPADER